MSGGSADRAVPRLKSDLVIDTVLQDNVILPSTMPWTERFRKG